MIIIHDAKLAVEVGPTNRSLPQIKHLANLFATVDGEARPHPL